MNDSVTHANTISYADSVFGFCTAVGSEAKNDEGTEYTIIVSRIGEPDLKKVLKFASEIPYWLVKTERIEWPTKTGFTTRMTFKRFVEARL